MPEVVHVQVHPPLMFDGDRLPVSNANDVPFNDVQFARRSEVYIRSVARGVMAPARDFDVCKLRSQILAAQRAQLHGQFINEVRQNFGKWWHGRDFRFYQSQSDAISRLTERGGV